MDINVRGPSYIELFGGIKLSASIVIGWIIIVAAFFFCRWLTKDLKKVPDTKRQAIAEMLVNTMNNMVDENLCSVHGDNLCVCAYRCTGFIAGYQKHDCRYQCNCDLGDYEFCVDYL